MEFYESLPQDLDITTMEDVVGLVVNYQIDKGGCWRFDMQVEEKLDGVVYTYFYWFEVNEWYFDYDFWRKNEKEKTYLISLAYEVDSHALSETYFLHLNSRTPHKEMLKIVFEEDLHSDQFLYKTSRITLCMVD